MKVVIPEGFTRAQIAVLAHRDGLSGSYLLPSKRSSEIDFAHYGAPPSTPNLEGFLFPATYEMYVGAPASQLVSEQLSAFHENFGGGEVDRARVLGIAPYQLLIVASIIEREAAIPHDRPAGGGGHLQPPAPEHDAGNRLHVALRAARLHELR